MTGMVWTLTTRRVSLFSKKSKKKSVLRKKTAFTPSTFAA